MEDTIRKDPIKLLANILEFIIVISISRAHITDVYGIIDIRVNLPIILINLEPFIIAWLKEY